MGRHAPDRPGIVIEVARAAQLVALVGAVLLAMRRRTFAPIAIALVLLVLANTTRAVLVAHVLAPARASMRAAGLDPALVPFHGGRELAAVAVNEASSLAGPAVLVAFVGAVFGTRRAVAAVAAWSLSSALLFMSYPATRGAVLARVLLAADVLGLAVAVHDVARWARRREAPKAEHVAALLFIAMSFATHFVTKGESFTRWALADVVIVVGYIAVTMLEVGAFITTRAVMR